MEEFFSNPAYLWLVAGAALVCFEIFAFPGIGFIFAGLAALVVGVVVQFGVISSFIGQWAAFFILTALWAALLWKPIKNFLKKPSGGVTYQNMIGSVAVVAAPGLEKGKKGQVRWSGTTMNAVLDEHGAQEKVAAGADVEIVAIAGNVLTVRVVE